MNRKNKEFDCVEMKNRIQNELRSEFEARKNEFSSYSDFISTTANQSAQIRAFREKFQKHKPS